ncbi:uncharacterized protein LOC106667944 isoform X2 [Cimex lectularius]|uniref:Uncharacterized protein n=1 Tax=Cimex lectularius TaxID=79782 RepID=A0A8I6ST84_CIMLE|nr:uncharacterized protein LOC106667944 isoform X2 [Cimex lectularius]
MKRDMLVLSILLCSAALTASFPSTHETQIQNENLLAEEEIDPDTLSDYLVYLLTSANDVDVPLVFVQEELPEPSNVIAKRTSVYCESPRYYRRYPWKRQNGRMYEPDGYLCSPTREDVFQLLMALHETRSGNGDRTVSFCNRRRPARAIVTNLRFLGKR